FASRCLRSNRGSIHVCESAKDLWRAAENPERCRRGRGRPKEPMKQRICRARYWEDWRWRFLAAAIGYLAFVVPIRASKIEEMTQTTLWAQAIRFVTLQDPSLRYALIGSVLIGVCCGLLGSFIVVRKLALMGDALSH